MKALRATGLAAGGVAVAVGSLLVLDQVTRAPASPPLGEFMSAATAYVEGQRASGQPPPVTVSLRELVAAGYLSQESARHFVGTEVRLSLEADQSRPQMIRMWVRLAGGDELALLNDGSVQTVTRPN